MSSEEPAEVLEHRTSAAPGSWTSLPTAVREVPDDRAATAGVRVARATPRALRWLVLVGCDLTCLAAALSLAYVLWAWGRLQQPTSIYVSNLPGLLLFPLVNAALGLYPGFGLGPVETLRRLSLATTASFVMLAALTFALKLPHVYSRVTITLAWTISLVLLPLGRSWLSALMSRVHWWGEPVVVIGSGLRRSVVIGELLASRTRGYSPVAALSLVEEVGPQKNAEVPYLGSVVLAPALARQGIRVAVLVQDQLSLGPLGAWLRNSFRHVIVVREDRELPVEHVEGRNLGGLLGIEFSNRLLVRRNRFVKRALDLVLGTFGFLVALPVMALAALAVKLVDGGPVFFFQDRECIGGRRIRICKLRTMYVDAEARLAGHLRSDPAAREQWERCFKLDCDPRVIPYVGRLMRRLSIDELPQLFHVIRGDMSLVGPRPFPDYHLDAFDPEVRELRRRVRPGLTGLWQVTVRSNGSLADQQAYDAYYIRNWSIWLDLYLIARTAGAVATGRGAC